MATDNRSREELLAENKELRYRLEEAEETLHALASGAADALVISMPEGGEQVFTLQGAEHPYRVLIETMTEGAVTLTSDGTILYCNKSMAALLQVPLEKLIGSVLLSYVAPADSVLFAARLESSMRGPEKGEISLLSGVGNPTPVLFSCCSVELSGSRGMNVLFTDITELKQAETQLQIAAERERAAEELLQSEKRYRELVQNANSAIIRYKKDGTISFFNEFAQTFFGYGADEVVGKHVNIIMPDQESSGADLTGLAQDIVDHPERYVNNINENICRDGRRVWMSWTNSPILDEQGRVVEVFAVGSDITERKQAEDRLKDSVQEKEVLLKEIHHRVKNNMQVISSLVNLQADTINDPDVQVHLQDIRDRVRSMALVHEKLYQADNLSGVPFDEYVRSLLNYLKNAYDKSEAPIQYTMDLQPVSLSVEKAVPCGLMLNELITNAFKHAFRGRTNGEVTTALHRAPDGTVCLRVSDDGVGMPLEQDWRKSKSLGLRLIDMLARQLNAIVELNCDKGTQFQITFKPSETAEGAEQSHE